MTDRNSLNRSRAHSHEDGFRQLHSNDKRSEQLENDLFSERESKGKVMKQSDNVQLHAGDVDGIRQESF